VVVVVVVVVVGGVGRPRLRLPAALALAAGGVVVANHGGELGFPRRRRAEVLEGPRRETGWLDQRRVRCLARMWSGSSPNWAHERLI
jgi:hypothetical protein